jgi:hypothetical protein
MSKKTPVRSKRFSLAPLSFDEAVTDLLKVKPERKAQKKKLRAKKRNKNRS